MTVKVCTFALQMPFAIQSVEHHSKTYVFDFRTHFAQCDGYLNRVSRTVVNTLHHHGALSDRIQVGRQIRASK